MYMMTGDAIGVAVGSWADCIDSMYNNVIFL